MGNSRSGFYSAIVISIVNSIVPPSATAQSSLWDPSAEIVESIMPSVVGIAIKGMRDPSEEDGRRKGLNAPVILM